MAEKLLTKASQRLDLPVDVVAGMPKVEIVGQQEFSMEPHDGLMAYSQTEILVTSKIGPIAVTGQNMTIKLMNQERIVIVGRLFGVALPGGRVE